MNNLANSETAFSSSQPLKLCVTKFGQNFESTEDQYPALSALRMDVTTKIAFNVTGDEDGWRIT